MQWLALDRRKLQQGEIRLLESPRNEIVISSVSLWEARIKWHAAYRSGQRKGEADPDRVVQLFDDMGFTFAKLSLTFDHCTATLDHPLDHNDPFDRLLLTQAQVEGMRLLTRDGQLKHHPLALYA